MKKVEAVHTIHRVLVPGVAATRDTPAVAPKVQVIKPGTIFLPNDDDEYASLAAAGAIRDAKKDSGPVEIEGGPGKAKTLDDGLDADDMTVAKLTALAAENNVDLGEATKKADIKALLRKAGVRAPAEEELV